MRSHIRETAGVWDSESGEFISDDHRRFAEILYDYNPYLSLVWIPRKNRGAEDTKPFAILSKEPNKPEHIVRYLTELEMNDPTKILTWLFEGDLNRHRPIDVFGRIEAAEAAENLMRIKKEQEISEENLDFIHFGVSNRSNNYWKHNGKTFRK